MVRTRYINELENLKNEIILYSAIVEKMLMDMKVTIETAAEDADIKDQLHEIESKEDEIREYNRNIETLCLKIMSTQQPVAKDLRFVSSTLNIIRNVEKIGGHVIEVAGLLNFVSIGEDFTEEILDMCLSTKKMLKSAIDAFITGDLEESYKVIASDDKIDALFSHIMSEVVERIGDKKDDALRLIDIIQIAKYFERIGDNAESIADWSVFSITSKHYE
ncbi:MAG: phosphate signaling complex protein PhoU [Eubacteriales bacterium]|uniref:phosphate signaling complex protein PhoU n=1 Tax=Fenollaria sp. TaxID=1965292 RepID=UPI002A75FC79|nr:phosphate signaling complex protein PhoU [Fenollaria sp.]MDD7339368.1 phosphate signaling complex protein PhoU [Eubacteriales bacterium]MDY3106119.1 phosphate signaling complex protein PhoU [Fenollaria sp.]